LSANGGSEPDRQQNVTTAKGPSQAVTSLNREFRAVLVNEEVAGIGRAVAQIVRGDGWHEAKASAVLVDAIGAGWDADAVQPMGFFANGTGPVEVVARVGKYYITGHGIETEDDLTVNVLRAPSRPVQPVPLEDWTWLAQHALHLGQPAGPAGRRSSGRLLAEEIDAEIARVVLGVSTRPGRVSAAFTRCGAGAGSDLASRGPKLQDVLPFVLEESPEHPPCRARFALSNRSTTRVNSWAVIERRRVMRASRSAARAAHGSCRRLSIAASCGRHRAVSRAWN
jgi:hypothetical protein